ncbi:carboxypeptidase-like regulatory domain-containing protein, partial [bacterium]|nr:carboxypeptidase-like regulatory domain-containing protein [bacterium]
MKKILMLLILSAQLSFAQKTIFGVVKDAATGEILPAANIQIDGTLNGVIASREGRYSIKVENFPATLIVRYIGYESKKIVINASAESEQNIKLNPAPIEMEALVVLGEDPGMRIMRNVITKKKSWHALIQNFRADAYMRSAIENDSGIVMISEVLAETYWDRKKGLRTVVKSKRHTKNISPKDNIIVGDEEMVNLYDDDILIQESRFVGPTHPDALDYYDFKIIGRRYRDDLLVYDISVQTKSKFQPTFVGQISVLDIDSVMIEADLRPNDFVIFPLPIQEWKVFYKQQFSNFGRAYWLPVDMRMEGKIKIGMLGLQFPHIKYTHIAGLNNYQINVELPDSLYRSSRSFILDSASIKKVNQFDSAAIMIPFSDREDSAFKMIKRGDSFSKAFKPTGALSRMIQMEDEYNDSIV